ncbi:PAS domain S-box-containing protein [Jatrophihabitans endophyticus]|uniref:PAS domain S-box-containing protein n=1 Tax=Jatrophihabitans endophyticus TaxID=1206085 RepID=A0A1M5HJS6_9ACTN|nr:PAS domain-containing protein [Jatrophihabitans endophyticus]SHG16229.1 PAS domain S-box-containing protein [Jatrophihabitans endophyticus]
MRPRTLASEPVAGPLASAASLATVVDHLPAIVALFDMDLRNRFTNWAHVPWFGLQPRDLVGCSPADIVGAATFAESRPYYDAVREGEPQTFERIMTLPTGLRRHAIVHYEPYRIDGEIRGVVTMATDVTGRARAEFARQELAARATAIGERERDAMAKQRNATERLNQMASELARVARRHPEHADAVEDAARTMATAAQRLRTLAQHRPGPGRPPGPERVVREQVEAGAAALGFLPTLLVMGRLDALDEALADLVGEVLETTLDNIGRHADATRVDVTVGVEHGDVVVVVADDGGGVVRPQAGSSLDRLRTIATGRGGRCSWVINSDDGTTVEWRVPLHPDLPQAGPANAAVVTPVDDTQRPPEGYRAAASPSLDEREMRALLEHLPIGLAVWDRDLRNQYANRIAARWFGLPEPEQMLGQLYGDIATPEAQARALPLARSALAGSHVVMERPFDTAPGQPRHIRSEFVPRVVGGSVVGIYVQVTDIGERVRAESAVREETARALALRERHAAEEEVHHLAIQEVFAAALRVDALRPMHPGAARELDEALAPLDSAVADLRESVVTSEAVASGEALGR